MSARHGALAALSLATLSLALAFAARSSRAPAAEPSPSAQAFLAYGRSLFARTKALMPAYVKANFSCSSCHLANGRRPHGLSLLGSYAGFPRWNARASRFIAVQDRIAECFLYSMNGKPPAYESREMIALTAYLASLATGVPVGSALPGQALVPVVAAHAPDRLHGRVVFGRTCSACHGTSGMGTTAAPPLWGPSSFNTGAGMFREDTLSAFVRYNMPLGAKPNTLSAQNAADVAAYVLSQRRPPFHGHAPVIFRPQPAHFF